MPVTRAGSRREQNILAMPSYKEALMEQRQPQPRSQLQTEYKRQAHLSSSLAQSGMVDLRRMYTRIAIYLLCSVQLIVNVFLNNISTLYT